MTFTVSPTPFSPNGDGVKDTTTIQAGFWDSLLWNLKIKDSAGNVVRNLGSGTGSSLSRIWDGKDGSGNMVPDGTYYAWLNGPGLAKKKPVTVDRTLPEVIVAGWDPWEFRPSFGETTMLFYSLSEKSSVSIKIYDSSGTTLKRTLQPWLTQTPGIRNAVWDGRDDYGNIVPAGYYIAKVWVKDMAGNKTTPYPATSPAVRVLPLFP